MKTLNLICTFVGTAVLVGSFQNCSASKDFEGTTSASSTSALSNTQTVVPLNNDISTLVCAAGSSSKSIQYYPTHCLNPSGLGANSIGFQTNNNYLITKAGGASSFNLSSDNASTGTANAAILYIEVATYQAPDSIVIMSQGVSGTTTQLLNICDIATYSSGDPTNGISRPYSDTILQFEVLLPAGTKSLKFDFSGATTPTYLGVWNLNEFSSSLAKLNPFSATLPKQANNFRLQSAPPAALNDNADPSAKIVCH